MAGPASCDLILNHEVALRPFLLTFGAKSQELRSYLGRQKFLRAQLLDRIPQFGCFFEFEALGGFSHIAF